ncbi:MAG: hypothetical protein ACXABY_03880 [Candidatus Thorarchaeota archaeon]|jgi:hypothetical protein
MTDSRYTFEDSTLVDRPVSESSKSDAHEMIRRGKNPQLMVTIDTTHSGVLTNGRVYPAKYVSNGYRSFISKERGGTAGYDKPILKHHDLHDDPIGRVVDATYTPLKAGSDFEHDFLTPEESGGKGSGVVTITGIVSDQDAIKKIIDGRFLSVSASHSTDKMLCSSCGDDIFDCSHVPGRYYKEGEDCSSEEGGFLCYGITSNMTYHECSFVNMPAQPPSKLVNFNWQDAKEKGYKEDTLIQSSYVRGKKDVVRAFCLTDEDGELSLLTGKHKRLNQRTVIAVNPAIADKLKHVVASNEIADEDGETEDVRHSSSEDREVADAEQNLSKASNTLTVKDSQMAENKNTSEFDALKQEHDSLKDELAATKTENEELKRTVESKDSEIQRLTDGQAALQGRMSKNLATALASFRIRLKKPDTIGIDSKEELEEYVQKLSQRSAESLQDSIADLVLELEEDKTPEKDKSSASDIAAGKKVESPVPGKGDKPKHGNSKDEKKDALSKELDF